MPRGSAASTSSKRNATGSSTQAPSQTSANNSANISSKKRSGKGQSGASNALLNANNVNSPASNPGTSAPQKIEAPALQPTILHLQNNHLSSDSSSLSSADLESDWSGKVSGRRYSEGSSDGLSFVYGKPEKRTSMDGLGSSNIEVNMANEKLTGHGVFTSILPSYPLLDTVMVLLLLLQLPSAVLTLAHALFAFFTFSRLPIPVFSGTGAPSWTTVLLQGTNGGPSIVTVVMTDILMAIISMFLWPSARTYLIEFAQAIMAITIGAGNCSQSGALKNAAVCVGVMTGSKVLGKRYESEWSLPLGGGRRVSGGGNNSASLFRSAIAVHIVAQGIMRATRSWLLQNPRFKNGKTNGTTAKQDSSTSKQRDPEAGISITASSTQQTVPEKQLKKKQKAIVQASQPLWAGLAKMVIQLAKFIEQKQTSAEASTESNVSSIIHKSTRFQGNIWITDIGSDHVHFGASHFGKPLEVEQNSQSNRRKRNGGAGKEGSIPFLVKVNGVVWPRTTINKSVEFFEDEDGDEEWMRADWTVEIAGLTPSTEYDFEFVSVDAVGDVLYRASACTIIGEDTPLPAVSQPKPSRPLSPVTTLLNSLQQANACLTEQRTKLKRTRKENSRRLTSLRNDIEAIKSRLGTSDKNEERSRRRVLFLREFVRRADEDIARMQKELDELSITEEDKAQYREKKKAWAEEKKRLADAQTAAEQAKLAAEQRIKNNDTEIQTLAQKRDKLEARVKKLRKDVERVEKERQEEKEKQKKIAERKAAEKHRVALEEEFSRAIGSLEQKTEDVRNRTRDNWLYVKQAEQAATASAPRTPEGSLPKPRGGGSMGSLVSHPGLLQSSGSLNQPSNPAFLSAGNSAQNLTFSPNQSSSSLGRKRSSSYLSTRETQESLLPTTVEEEVIKVTAPNTTTSQPVGGNIPTGVTMAMF
ncbi:hypothetical protein BJ508DRAFT_136515 [Ascobolus immersus RN42]|uniref:Ubiquitination network signaling protein n=1 Tax=Ascobolus immersus RN42 TaxID=1160509 RepID=A0A3N4IKI0_ASCIM|nr:hypothetical protein BJ508DRAFT_136515 [Ascobolus immersus RN42]